MGDAQLHATTDDVEDQHVNLAQKNVNGILLVFPGVCGQSIERLRTRSDHATEYVLYLHLLSDQPRPGKVLAPWFYKKVPSHVAFLRSTSDFFSRGERRQIQ
jgi:hypothetical protein